MLFFLDTWDYTVDIVPQSLNGWINVGKEPRIGDGRCELIFQLYLPTI